MPLTKTWADAVVTALLADERAQLFKDAIETGMHIAGIKAIALDADELLEWLRNDEPEIAFDEGDTPAAYADFLLTEWDLYGIEGE